MNKLKTQEWVAIVAGVVVVGVFFLAPRLFPVQNPGTSTQSAAVTDVNATPDPAAQQSAAPTPIPGLPDVTNLKTVQVQDVKVGTGAEAKSGSAVQVNYIGMLTNGTTFDSSEGKSPLKVGLGNANVSGYLKVVPGFEQGVIGMKVGGQRRIVIPAALAYGAQQVGPIPPNSVLVFDLQLVSVDN